MKLKKLISLLAIFTIASTMITLPVKATVDYSWHMDESAVNSDANSGPAVTDFAGKGSGYTYGFTGNATYIWLTSSFADSSKCLQIPDDYLTYEGYMLISMNVYSPAGQQFQFQTGGGKPITPNYTVSEANGFSINKWNKMLAIVKLSATKANRDGYWYINGEKKDAYHSTEHLMFDSETYNKVRLKTNNNNKALYIDDVHVAFTKDALTTAQLDALAAMPTLISPSGTTCTVGGVDKVTGNVTVAHGTTLANLQEENTNTLTAYTDSTFTTTVAQNTVLQDGNVIIATDSLGKMSYFNVDIVGENYSWWHMDESAVNSGANSYVTQNNLAGKGNGYTYCYKTSTWFGFTSSFADASKKLTIPENYTSYEGYMLISMNVYSPDEQQFWFTDGSARFTRECVVTGVNNFSKSKWNKVLAVVQLSTDESKRISYYYINGIKSGNLGSTYKHNLFASSSSKEIRLATGTGSRYLYIDDVYVAFVPGAIKEAQLNALAAMPTLTTLSGSTCNVGTVDKVTGKITVDSGTTLANLQEENTNTLTAYDSTLIAPVASNTPLSDGDVIIATDSRGKMSYFNVVLGETHKNVGWFFEGEDAVNDGSNTNVTEANGFSGDTYNKVTGSATTTFTTPADEFDLYITVGANIDTVSLPNGQYVASAAISIDGGDYIKLTADNTKWVRGLYGTSTLCQNSGKWKYEPGLNLTEGEHTFTIKKLENAANGNNFIVYDCFKLVPKNAEIWEAKLGIPSSELAWGDTMQADSKLYYTTGYLCDVATRYYKKGTYDDSDILSIRYNSSDPAVATVNSDGLITAINPGIANISVTYTDRENKTYTDSTEIAVYNESGIVPISAGYNESTGIATVELKRVKDSEGQSDVVFGAYEEENGRKSLSSVQIEDEINPQIGQTATVEKTITGDVIDAFIWKSKESMIPLAKAINLKSNEQNNDFSEYVDFVVDVEEGREPVILQITDTQIIDSSQRRTKSRISDTAIAYWNPDKMDELCFDYLREVVAETKPDFIIMTGDNVYGEFDDDGSCFKALVDVMESFNIPWAPIYGNHDAETALGVDWQCARLENAPNCLFKQRTLTGNGNYSVGITQGGELKRVFFMLDSNGAANISEKTLANGHSTATRGFGQDQIAWYTAAAQKINNAYPGMKYSFAYHIPLTIAQEAIGRYQKVTEDNDSELIENLGKLDDGDFGYICGGFNSKWDKDKIIYEGMKALGCDSHFFGHEHTYSASVVYDGTRFQFGQKSSDYDEINHMLADGTVKKGAATSDGTPMVGGTVMKMAQDGSFSDLHIHYCDGIIE